MTKYAYVRVAWVRDISADAVAQRLVHHLEQVGKSLDVSVSWELLAVNPLGGAVVQVTLTYTSNSGDDAAERILTGVHDEIDLVDWWVS